MKILGAGVSGLTAAINLAKAGEKVGVYEKSEDVGQHIGSTAQMLPNWMSKEDIIGDLENYGIKINHVAKVNKAELFVFGKEVKVHTKTPMGYTVIRGGEDSFEMSLKRQAEDLGVDVKTGWKRKVDADIVATGPSKAKAVIYGRVYEGKFDKSNVKVFLDFETSPGGYSYLYPHSKKRASLVLGKIAEDKRNIKRDMRMVMEKFGDFIDVEEKDFLYEFSKFADFEIPDTAVKNRSIFVGEAAGFQDPLLGFGMKFAIHSGYLAAKSIIEDSDYDELWKGELMPVMRKLLMYRNFLFNPLNRLIIKSVPDKGEHVIDMDTIQETFHMDFDEMVFKNVIKKLF